MVEGKMSDFVSCHGPVVVNSAQTVAFLCDEPGNHTVSRLELEIHRFSQSQRRPLQVYIHEIGMLTQRS